MLKIESILDLVDRNADDYNEHLSKAIENDEEYKSIEKEFRLLIETLHKKVGNEIEDAAVALETRARDIAFREGFNIAIRLIFASIAR